jgi:hypothetical protein
VINSYSALTRVVAPASAFTTTTAKDTTYGGHATTVYTLTAGTCAAMYTARGNNWGAECTGTDDPHIGCTGSGAPAELAGLASNCPAGCKFVGPLNSNELRRSITSPIPCTDVTNTGAGTTVGKLQAPTVLCPKNTVAGVEKGLADIDVRRQTIAMASADTAAEAGQSFQLRDTVVTGVMAGALTLDADASNTANYYVGWRIETTAPKASGTVLTSDSSRVLTVEWDEAKACDTGFARGDPTCVAIAATGVAEIAEATMASATALNSGIANSDDDYYNGWTIVADVDGTWGGTDVHTGMIIDFTGSDQTVKIDWYTTGDPTGSVPVVHTAAAPTLTGSSKYKLRKGTYYTLTANCPAGPKNKNMVVSEEDNTNLLFKPGSLEHWTPDPGNTEALERAKCTVVRDVDGLYSARMPAGTFTDAGGNPNTISTACSVVTGSYAASECIHDEPYVVTSDVTAPSLTITASDDNWMTTLHNGETAQGQRITFRFELSERPALIVGTAASTIDGPTNAGDGDLTTGHDCADPVWSGSGRVYYLRCNAIAVPATAADAKIEIEIAASKFKDLGGTVNVASSVAADSTAKFSVISDVVRPEVIITAAAGDGTPATIDSGSFINEAVTFTVNLVDQGATALVPTNFPGCSNPDTTEGCWTTQTAAAPTPAPEKVAWARQLVKQQSTNCAEGVFTVGAGSNLAPTLACTVLTGQDELSSIAVASMDAAAGSITVGTAETTITDVKGPGQILRIVPKRVGAVDAITGEPTTAMSGVLTLHADHFGTGTSSAYATDDYFNGWTIVTATPAGKGIISDFTQSSGLIAVAWDEVITTTTSTTYTLLAPCSAAPLNTDLVIDTVTSTNTVYTFRSGQAPTARKTDATGQAGTADNPYGGIHGVDTDANFAIECALTRPANDDIAITVPANAFADVALNGNVASRPQKGGGGVAYSDADDLTIAPFLVTLDVDVPTMEITIYEADGVTELSSADSTGSKAVIFKLHASEHIVKTVDPWAPFDASCMSTLANCAGTKFWGWKDIFYIRCDWKDATTVTIGAAANKFMDLATNDNAQVNDKTVVFT